MRVKSCTKKSVFKVSVNSEIMNFPLPEEERGKSKDQCMRFHKVSEVFLCLNLNDFLYYLRHNG